MSENYTKGKLYQLPRSPDIVHAEQGNRGRRICCTESMGDKAENEANARRIVACWNIFEGMTTEQIAALAQHAETVRALVAPLLEKAQPTPQAEATVCDVDACTFVNDPQPHNQYQSKCSKCGYILPF